MIKIFPRKLVKFPGKQNSLLYKIELPQEQEQKGVLKAISTPASTTYKVKKFTRFDKSLWKKFKIRKLSYITA